MKELHFYYRMYSGFTAPITDHSFTLKCFPQSGKMQEITILKQNIDPVEWMADGIDSFGNAYIYGGIASLHSTFSVELEGIARVDRLPGYETDPCREMMYLFPTSLTVCSKEMEEFARTFLEKWFGTEEYGPQFRESMYALMEEIYHYMEYAPQTTTVYTAAGDAFAMRKGVCQDYAHIMIALCRRMGIPAAYVAGYMIGEGASHAWVTVFDRGTGIWYEIDPTNDRWVDDNYIRVSVGCDAGDCVMNKGIYKGFSSEYQEITVIVEERA